VQSVSTPPKTGPVWQVFLMNDISMTTISIAAIEARIARSMNSGSPQEDQLLRNVRIQVKKFSNEELAGRIRKIYDAMDIETEDDMISEVLRAVDDAMLKDLSVKPDLILSSTFFRVAQTAEILAKIVKYEKDTACSDAFIPASSRDTLIGEINEKHTVEKLVLVGHETAQCPCRHIERCGSGNVN
jgi:hypothetical protein